MESCWAWFWQEILRRISTKHIGNTSVSGAWIRFGNPEGLTLLEATPERFPLAAQKGKIGRVLTTEEKPGLWVDVAGHEVQYNKALDCWYSDIQIAGIGNYFPFVRLALARYQPKSMHDVELSEIVLTDFIQLPPDRSAAIIVGRSNGVESVMVSVTGPAPNASSKFPGTNGELPNILEASFEDGCRWSYT